MAADNRNRGFGDGEHMFGVRNRGFTVEIKKWCEGFNFYKDVKEPLEVAAMVHDLARTYSDQMVDPKRLNTPALVLRIARENYPAQAASGLFLTIDKTRSFSELFLNSFVKKHSLRRVGDTSKERAAAMATNIVELAPLAFGELKDEIAREYSWRRGRQRADLHEIHPVVQDDELLELIKEVQHLNATIVAKDEACKAKDAALKAKDDEIEALKAELHNAAGVRAANLTPFKRGFAEREGLILQNDSDADVSASLWVDTCLTSTNTMVSHHPTH